jgi:hypothetical protein
MLNQYKTELPDLWESTSYYSRISRGIPLGD